MLFICLFSGVAVTLNGNFLVADYDNKWVSIFDAAGKFVNKVGTGKLLGKPEAKIKKKHSSQRFHIFRP